MPNHRRPLTVKPGKRPKQQPRPHLPVFSMLDRRVRDTATRLVVSPSPMNGLETDWAEQLEIDRFERRLVWWGFQAIKLRLGLGAWYTPDFFVLLSSGAVRIDETKGHWEEAARVRIKAAAGLYPMFQFHAVTRKSGVWKCEAIRSTHTLLGGPNAEEES